MSNVILQSQIDLFCATMIINACCHFTIKLNGSFSVIPNSNRVLLIQNEIITSKFRLIFSVSNILLFCFYFVNL